MSHDVMESLFILLPEKKLMPIMTFVFVLSWHVHISSSGSKVEDNFSKKENFFSSNDEREKVTSERFNVSFVDNAMGLCDSWGFIAPLMICEECREGIKNLLVSFDDTLAKWGFADAEVEQINDKFEQRTWRKTLPFLRLSPIAFSCVYFSFAFHNFHKSREEFFLPFLPF